MERFAIKKLLEWKESYNRKPLVIMGARQVGKTWLMKEFGKQYYSKVAYISFYNNNRAAEVFESDYDIDRILLSLNIESRTTITPGDTLIILDEIQNAPKAFESLKYFCEDASEYHVVAAGSLLGVAIHKGISYPVGKVDMLDLYPMNYREFLYAVGEKQLADLLLTKDYSVINNFGDKYLFYLKNYMYIGGMPSVVDSYVQTKDYKRVRLEQTALVKQYKGDFGKHVDSKELARINMVWDAIPIQLAKENKKFFFGQIKKGGRSAEFEMAIQWLVDSGLLYRVYRVNEPNVPLAAYKNFSAYKLFILDVGILGALSGVDSMSIIEGNSLFVEYKGAIAEQYVLQQIISDTDYDAFYYGTEQATFEQDFMIQKGTSVIPIEVKSDENVRSKSLKAFFDKYHPDRSVRFSAKPYVDRGWMENIPLYAICNL